MVLFIFLWCLNVSTIRAEGTFSNWYKFNSKSVWGRWHIQMVIAKRKSFSSLKRNKREFHVNVFMCMIWWRKRCTFVPSIDRNLICVYSIVFIFSAVIVQCGTRSPNVEFIVHLKATVHAMNGWTFNLMNPPSRAQFYFSGSNHTRYITQYVTNHLSNVFSC